MEFVNNYNRLSGLLESSLAEMFASSTQRVDLAANYSLTAGGKCFRGVLSLAVAEALEIEPQGILPFASAVECLHAASLIHDDLPALDNDDLRRGKPSCHRAYDEATAILAGDLLFAEAFRLVLNSAEVSAEARAGQAAELATAFALLCQGQDLDLLSTESGQSADTLESLEDRHLRKTASLIQACTVGPVYLLGTPKVESLKSALSSFGTNLGLLFQVTDDILDVTGTTEQLGKAAASDEAQHTGTFVTLLGVDGALDYAKALHKTIVSQLSSLEFESRFLIGLADFVLSRDR